MKLSRRAQQMKPSATLAITAQAKQMRAEGIDVIGFGAGEPDFPTPSHIIDAGIAALHAGATVYTPVGGTPQLKQAISDSIDRDYGLSYAPAEITASCGAKHTLFNLFLALLDEGDEVIIPSPYWVSYPEQVRVAGGVPVVAHTREEDEFRVRPEALAAALTDRTVAFVLNSPGNPTGAMYDAESLEKLAAVLDDRDVLVVSDDIYHRIVYPGNRFTSILDVAPQLRDRVVIVNGVSKTFAMTGWRIGYAAGPGELIRAMEKLQSQSTSNPAGVSQAAAVEALLGPQQCVSEMLQAFEARRTLLVDGLNSIPGLRCALPAGAFYAFPNITGLFGAEWEEGTIADSFDVTRFLLQQAQVAVVPGAPFGADTNMRLSYAAATETIELGLERISRAVSGLTGA